MSDKIKVMPGRNGGTLNVGGNHGGGRPRKLPSLDEVGERVLNEEQKGMTAIEAIVRRLAISAIKGDNQAAKILLDRFYGVTTQMPQMPESAEGAVVFYFPNKHSRKRGEDQD